MRKFISELHSRNKILYRFGWLTLICSMICAILTQVNTNNIVLGIDAWIKPAKFFISVAVFSWTMAWYMYYLDARKKVNIYSWVVVLVMSFELVIITWQAANGRLSHFNISTPLYSALFDAMGGA